MIHEGSEQPRVYGGSADSRRTWTRFIRFGRALRTNVSQFIATHFCRRSLFQLVASHLTKHFCERRILVQRTFGKNDFCNISNCIARQSDGSSSRLITFTVWSSCFPYFPTR